MVNKYNQPAATEPCHAIPIDHARSVNVLSHACIRSNSVLHHIIWKRRDRDEGNDIRVLSYSMRVRGGFQAGAERE